MCTKYNDHQVRVVLKKGSGKTNMLATLIISKHDTKWRFPELLDSHWFFS